LDVKKEYIDMDEKGIICDNLSEKEINIVHVSPAHHFPTGIIMPATRRSRLLSWAYESENRYIIEDDYDSEFRLNGKPVEPLMSLDTCDRVIYMNTFNKSLSPTLRISYMVLPESLCPSFTQKLGFYSCTVSNFMQFTLADFISEGHFEKHINRMRSSYLKKRNLIIRLIKESSCGKYITIHNENAGLHFLLTAKTSKSDSVITVQAAKYGLKIYALSSYYFENKTNDSHTFIINYSDLRDEDIAPAVEILADLFTPPRG